MAYREGPVGVPGVVLWRSEPAAAVDAVGPVATRVLPDGCLDLTWDGTRLFVAGPDTTARVVRAAAVTRTALRLSAGVGSALLGVPAGELRDRTVNLDALWPAQAVRRLTDVVARDPEARLRRLASDAARERPPDPLGAVVLALAAARVPVPRMAATLALSERQLRRRCYHLVGYGPTRLARVLRLQRALELARSGVDLARVAHECGYADQAHLSPACPRRGSWPSSAACRRRAAPRRPRWPPQAGTAPRTGPPACRRGRAPPRTSCPRRRPTAGGGQRGPPR